MPFHRTSTLIIDARARLLQLGVTLIAYVYLGCVGLATTPWPGA